MLISSSCHHTVFMNSSTRLPKTTFPTYKNDAQIEEKLFSAFCEELSPIFVLSDSAECNKNISIVLKMIVDYLEDQKELFHLCSKLALRVLRLNLFVKNHRLCIAKFLTLLDVLSQPDVGSCDEAAKTLEVFTLVVLLLMLKIFSQADSTDHFNVIKPAELMLALKDLYFFETICTLISRRAKALDNSRSSYILIKFNCDLVFQYLFHTVLLSESQFAALSESDVIPNVIKHLLCMGCFNNYNSRDEDSEEIRKLISYEEFNLILLLNEQYMMRLLTTSNLTNKVFECLCVEKANSRNGICAFTNILVYHMNREKSHVVKILMLKFLYLIFTLSFSASLPYLNDLKILVDIIIRELDNLNYCSEDDESSLLALTYAKVLFPLLKFSQLSDLKPAYKPAEIAEVLSNIILNCETSLERTLKSDGDYSDAIVKTAVKCFSTPCLRTSKPTSRVAQLITHLNESKDSMCSLSSHKSRTGRLRRESADYSPSTESLSIACVSTVRAASANNYSKTNQTLVSKKLENLTPSEDSFYSVFELQQSLNSMSVTNPSLNSKVSPPIRRSRVQPASSSILMKALQKKAPPPPPTPHQRRII